MSSKLQSQYRVQLIRLAFVHSPNSEQLFNNLPYAYWDIAQRLSDMIYITLHQSR